MCAAAMWSKCIRCDAARPRRSRRSRTASKGDSQVVGRAIEDIDLPKGAAIVALVRGDQVIIAHHDTVIESDDHVILFLTDRRKIEQLEKLFQVGVSFV